MAKSDFEKIVAQYAEMMATAASIVPECVDLIFYATAFSFPVASSRFLPFLRDFRFSSYSF